MFCPTLQLKRIIELSDSLIASLMLGFCGSLFLIRWRWLVLPRATSFPIFFRFSTHRCPRSFLRLLVSWRLVVYGIHEHPTEQLGLRLSVLPNICIVRIPAWQLPLNARFPWSILNVSSDPAHFIETTAKSKTGSEFILINSHWSLPFSSNYTLS